MDKKEIEYIYKNNPKTYTQVMVDWVRGVLETVLPFLKFGPFPALLDKLFASRLARQFLGAYVMVLMM